MPEEMNVSQNVDQQSQDQSESHSAQDPGGNRPEWIPEELTGEKTLHKFKDLSTFGKAYVELEKDASRLRNIKLNIPGEDAKPEDWDNVYNKLGRPEKPEEYKFNNEGIEVDEQFQTAIKPVLHKAGVSQKQADIIANGYNEIQKGALEAIQRQNETIREKTTGEFKKEWGSEFDANLKKADEAGHKVFGKNFMSALKQSGLNNSPEVIRGLFKLSELVGEHDFVNTNMYSSPSVKVTFEKILSMKQDPRYWDTSRRDPDFVKQVEAMNEEYAKSKGA